VRVLRVVEGRLAKRVADADERDVAVFSGGIGALRWNAAGAALLASLVLRGLQV